MDQELCTAKEKCARVRLLDAFLKHNQSAALSLMGELSSIGFPIWFSNGLEDAQKTRLYGAPPSSNFEFCIPIFLNHVATLS